MSDTTAGQAEHGLWADERIEAELRRIGDNMRLYIADAATVAQTVRDEYEQALAAKDKRIAELESQVSFAAKLANARLEVAQWQEARIAELEAQLAERGEWTMLGEGEQQRVQICEFHYIEEAGDDAARFFDAWVTATAIVFDNHSIIELPEDEYRIFRRVQREDE